MLFHAHSGTPNDKSDWQSLADHSKAVARLAAEFAKPMGLEKAAYITGLFHDLGKYNPEFQRRLEGADIRVDHSTAGAALLKSLIPATQRGMDQIIGYCILGHHAGLPDKNNEFAHCFERRIEAFEAKPPQLVDVWKSELAPDLTGLMSPTVVNAIQGNPYQCFDLSVVVRFLFSCLVDADFKDTEIYYQKRENREPDRKWPSLESLLPEFLSAFDAKMTAMPKGNLNETRNTILSHVRGKANMPPGLFTLTVPTGGGKTLASLGFALDHAMAHGHRRIIYSIPFTSIIDQVATIFKNLLGEENVLEHHSAIDEDEARRRRGETKPRTSRDRMKLAMEDWAAPVIVTTNVQFFESLFAARTSRARKLHNIAGSIIILDEAQTIPRHLLMPCVRMLDALARLAGCTIVLCTATQPALGKDREKENDEKGFKGGLPLLGRELALEPEKLFEQLKRTTIRIAGDLHNNDLIDALRAEPQALIIVNSRKHALELYNEAKVAELKGLVHLTTRQCAAHRWEILADVRERLKGDTPCRVIATSLIEAGVDVDFPRVWRAMAGLDQIIQAAGRCNREGRRSQESSIVTVFSAPDYPAPSEIKGLIGDMDRTLKNHRNDPQTLAAIREYFGEVYWRLDEKLDGKEKSKAILPRLQMRRAETDFAFRSIAQDFRMIENGMEPVIVVRDGRAEKAVNDLSVEQISSGALARKLQLYIVQVPPKARDLLIRNGHVAFERPDLRGDQFAVLRAKRLYSEEVGLIWDDNADYMAFEGMMVI